MISPTHLRLAVLPLILSLPLVRVAADEHQAESSRGESGQASDRATRFEFATVEQGREVLGSVDDFVARMSRFDLQARLGTKETATTPQYLSLARDSVIPWSDEQRNRLGKMLDAIQSSLADYRFPNLPEVLLIQTNGTEEYGAAYTRGNAIVLSQMKLTMPDAQVKRLLLHELFHVVSRNHPELRDGLYEIIGFRRSNEIRAPESLSSIKITNPDAPILEHVMTVKLDDETEQTVTPILYAKSDYDPEKIESMFGYLQVDLLQVSSRDGGDFVPDEVDGQPVLHPMALPDFHRQIGRNTGYIIHPEEVLADNFALLVQGTSDVKDRWILDQMQEKLSAPKQ